MTQRQTRVLQVITATDRRGAEIFACELADGLARRRLLVRTVALSPGRSAATLDVETLGPHPLGAAALRQLRAEAGRVDVVIAHGSRTLPACALGTLGMKTRFVYRVIGDPRHWSSSPLRRLRVRLFLSQATAIVGLWSTAAAELVAHYGVSPDKIRVIPNGASQRFAPPSAVERVAARQRFKLDLETTVIVYLGALSPEKDVPVAIAALAEIPSAHLLVVGDGVARAHLEQLGRRLAPGRVHFAGSIAEPASALAAADVVVLPSRSEGMPAVAIEAGLTGLPVVATDVGGVGEIVRHGQTGFLVAVGDAQGLASALRSAIGARDELGRNARDWCVERFDMDTIADSWSELIRDVAQGRRGDQRDFIRQHLDRAPS